MTKQHKQPELLSPAGSLEAFFAALENGADAVYAGLHAFSARAKAKNFSLADLEQMLAYAHSRDRRVYVTLNTLVKEKELPALVETLAALESIGTDAVICQDMAVARLVREHFPGLRLHASTQMTIHNSAGIKILEQLGFKRAVLARELTLEEIATIHRETSLELEHFVHGALCFSFSGQCYFSSFLGGKSGNRGRCAQPCRRRYRHRRDQGYYFSTNDLSAIELLDDLTKAGIGSFKVEGRMKSAEYVASVIGAYRSVLDAPPKQRPEAIQAAKQSLKDSFGRPPTKGFLAGSQPTDIAVPQLHGATGRFLGKVEQARSGRITFKTGSPLQIGDRVRIQPQNDQAGKAFTLKQLFKGQKKCGQVKAGEFVTIVSPFKEALEKGDAVFKVSSRQAFSMSDAACRRLLASVKKTNRIDLDIRMPDNASLQLSATATGNRLQQTYPVETFPATDRPLDTEALRTVFSQGGKEQIELAGLTVATLPPVVIRPSRLKEIRRDFYQKLRKELDSGQKDNSSASKQQALSSLLPSDPGVPSGDRPRLTVAVRSLQEARLLENREVDRLRVMLEPGTETRLGKLPQRLKKDHQLLSWELPFIIFDRQWPAFAATIDALIDSGWTCFHLNNLSHFAFFSGRDDLQLTTGYRLFSLNSQAALGWRDLGASGVTLYLEDDRENMQELLSRRLDIDREVVAYAQVPLMTTRVPMPRVKSEAPLVSSRNEHYLVRRKDEISTIAAATDFSLLGKLHLLRGSGCNFCLDLSHISAFSQEGKTALSAYQSDRSIAGTSLFNFEYGME
ncbi:MAG: peptidase U32 [Desulfuromonas sp.]|nr:MAG: peptidase U32 [Desulfuromonas sp.]